MIRAGARGYVTKTISGEELAAAIERVASGDAVFSPRLAGFVLDAFRAGEQVGGDAELDELTPREREVLQLIARGYLYKEIAARLRPLGEDRREPRLERAAEAAALDAARADALGDAASPRVSAGPGEGVRLKSDTSFRHPQRAFATSRCHTPTRNHAQGGGRASDRSHPIRRQSSLCLRVVRPRSPPPRWRSPVETLPPDAVYETGSSRCRRFRAKPLEAFEVFDQWIEIVPTRQRAKSRAFRTSTRRRRASAAPPRPSPAVKVSRGAHVVDPVAAARMRTTAASAGAARGGPRRESRRRANASPHSPSHRAGTAPSPRRPAPSSSTWRPTPSHSMRRVRPERRTYRRGSPLGSPRKRASTSSGGDGGSAAESVTSRSCRTNEASARYIGAAGAPARPVRTEVRASGRGGR